MTTLNRDIKNIIQILLRNNVPAIYPTEIAHLLHCEAEIVEDILYRMVEDEKVEQAYELHCGECGEVMAVFEHPDRLTSAPFPCPACYTQMESIIMNETVNTFYPQGKRRVLYD